MTANSTIIRRFNSAGFRLTEFNIGDGFEPISDWSMPKKTTSDAVIGTDIINAVDFSVLCFKRENDHVSVVFVPGQGDPADRSWNDVNDYSAREDLHPEIDKIIG